MTVPEATRVLNAASIRILEVKAIQNGQQMILANGARLSIGNGGNWVVQGKNLAASQVFAAFQRAIRLHDDLDKSSDPA